MDAGAVVVAVAQDLVAQPSARRNASRTRTRAACPGSSGATRCRASPLAVAVDARHRHEQAVGIGVEIVDPDLSGGLLDVPDLPARPERERHGLVQAPTTSRAWIREPADAGVDASASWATRQVPMMTAIRLRMPAPLQFVRMTTSTLWLGSSSSIVGRKGAGLLRPPHHPAYGRVLGCRRPFGPSGERMRIRRRRARGRVPAGRMHEPGRRRDRTADVLTVGLSIDASGDDRGPGPGDRDRDAVRGRRRRHPGLGHRDGRRGRRRAHGPGARRAGRRARRDRGAGELRGRVPRDLRDRALLFRRAEPAGNDRGDGRRRRTAIRALASVPVVLFPP